MSIPFLRKFPHDKAVVQQVERPKDIEAIAHTFLKAGGWYMSEITPFGTVRLTATDDDLHALVVVDTVNGPQIMDSIDDLIERSRKFIRTEN